MSALHDYAVRAAAWGTEYWTGIDTEGRARAVEVAVAFIVYVAYAGLHYGVILRRPAHGFAHRLLQPLGGLLRALLRALEYLPWGVGGRVPRPAPYLSPADALDELRRLRAENLLLRGAPVASAVPVPVEDSPTRALLREHLHRTEQIERALRDLVDRDGAREHPVDAAMGQELRDAVAEAATAAERSQAVVARLRLLAGESEEAAAPAAVRSDLATTPPARGGGEAPPVVPAAASGEALQSRIEPGAASGEATAEPPAPGGQAT